MVWESLCATRIPNFFAGMVQRYGPERLMINTDHTPECGCDILAIPKTIRELQRRRVDNGSIRLAVFDNANKFFGLGLDL